MTRRITWTWEETVLAGWAAARNGWRGVNMTAPVVQELSHLLQTLPVHPVPGRPEDFRSPAAWGGKSTACGRPARTTWARASE